MNQDEPRATHPWHRGEQRLQAAYGVAERMAVVGAKVIRPLLPDQHRAFYAELPFMIVGAVDGQGAAWATLLEGTPGFVRSPDPTTLQMDALPPAGDPVRDGVDAGAALGLLGIELHTRRRNRVNGVVRNVSADGFELAVVHSFGNCPRYIQTRDWRFDRTPGSPAIAAERLTHLDSAAAATIAAADTCFVASYVDVGGDHAARAVDVSHRGGCAGFIRVDGDMLTIPDFAGNLFFNTLGNLLENPRAGLLFVDFTSGDLLQLTGRTTIVFEGSEVAAFAGAERLWRLAVEQVVRRPAALALRWRFGAYSPHLADTGSWSAT